MSLRALPILLFVVPTVAAAQKPGDWRKVGVAPMAFAKNVDLAYYNLKSALGEASYTCQFFDGSRGQAIFTNRIRDRKNFRVEFVFVSEGKKDPFGSQMLIGKNGSVRLVANPVGQKILPSGKDPGFIPANKSLVAAWPQHFQQAMFMPYITGKGVFQPFIQGLTKGDGGFSLRMDERTIVANEGRSDQIRLYATRTPAMAKKLGNATIEIISDRHRWLPLKIRVDMTDLKGRRAFYEWSSKWSGPFRFDNKWFEPPRKN